MADPTTTHALNPDTPAGPKTMDAGKWANKRVYLRLVIYTAGIHVFAGFIMLLFELGSRNR
ncbi:DUF6126 family protein [Streptomyces sp. NRRL WC-3742]|uniref:DUF6126 family protein n=1 Tax=Streptomyces sp. NRRL WC-3742 TaxID=1463934 RepID=UPI0004C60DB8|nr:DUF6126 family protein [Streptomyces sp. NRRL WC-3742]